MSTTTRSEGLATITDVGKFLNVSRPTVYRLMNAKVLPYVKLGRSRRIKWDDVDRIIDENTTR